jgi:hypothetical protein
MKIRTPSPAMTVACIALFVALGGTAIAAVDYATNAGAVDGKSAVASDARAPQAAGNLVATAPKGTDRGRIPARFLAGVVQASAFGKALDVTDNTTGTNATLASVPGIGKLTATCQDQSDRVTVEDPATVIALTNKSGAAIALAKQLGGNNANVLEQANETVQMLIVTGSNTFRMSAQTRRTTILIDGVLRQDGRGTPDASCRFYGTIMVVDRAPAVAPPGG